MSGTIAAIATGADRPVGINIIRISGEDAAAVVKRIFVSRSIDGEMTPNRMYLGTVNGKYFKERAFCVFYKAPKSYTGEDVAEIHCHGGKGVTQAILRLVTENGARLAEAGEFTKRAFLNGKLSLSEAEGVADMLSAETESQVRNAYQLMSGELTKGIVKAAKDLVTAAAMLEAKMDYPEELEEETDGAARVIIEAAAAETDRLIKSAERGRIIRNGAQIVIIGIPNAGKSSLLNAIVKDERAIVTPIAGTTRDVLRERVEIDGVTLNFVDTAGIHESEDEIEKIGVERSRKALDYADVIIFLRDGTVENDREEEIERLLSGREVIVAVNKSDIGTVKKEGLPICAKTGQNVEALIKKVIEKVGVTEDGAVTEERHLSALRECRGHLTEALNGLGKVPSECTAVDLYAASEALEKITGERASEKVIDEIFSRFCVGK